MKFLAAVYLIIAAGAGTVMWQAMPAISPLGAAVFGLSWGPNVFCTQTGLCHIESIIPLGPWAFDFNPETNPKLEKMP